MKQINPDLLKIELKDLQETINEQLDQIVELEGEIPLIEYDLIMENLRSIYSAIHTLYKIHAPKDPPKGKDPMVESPPSKPVIQIQPEPPLPERTVSFSIAEEPARPASLPIDLKTFITINDKFLFINEFFGGNLKEYGTMIDHMNAIKSKTETFQFLEEIVKKGNWNVQSPAFRKLKELIERRFS